MSEEETAFSNTMTAKMNGDVTGNNPDGRDQTFHQRISQQGIVYNHAYSILNACQLEKRSKGKYDYNCGFEEEWQVIKLRNPWGKVEWNGPWGVSSTMWDVVRKGDIRVMESACAENGTFEQRSLSQEDEKQILKEKEESSHSGIFWMETQDFIKNFAGICISEIQEEYMYSSLEFDPSIFRDRKSLIQKHSFGLDIKSAGSYTVSLHQVDKLFFQTSKKQYEYKYVRLGVLDLMRSSEEVRLIACTFEQARNVDVKLENLKEGTYIILVDLYKTCEAEEETKFVLSTFGPKKTDLKFFNLPMSRDAEAKLIMNPNFVTPLKMTEKIFWCEFIKQNLDGLFQHRDSFRLKSENREVVEINYYEFTKLEDEQENPGFRFGANQVVSDKRKEMIASQKQLMETYFRYGIETIEKWTVEDIIYQDEEERERNLVAQYSSNSAFQNKNMASQFVAEESEFDWGGLAYEKIDQMGELSEIMRYTKQRYDSGFKIFEVVMIHLRNPIPDSQGFARPHM